MQVQCERVLVYYVCECECKFVHLQSCDDVDDDDGELMMGGPVCRRRFIANSHSHCGAAQQASRVSQWRHVCDNVMSIFDGIVCVAATAAALAFSNTVK